MTQAKAGAGLGEFGRIATYFRPLAVGVPGAFDLTDDAAVLDVPADQQLVATCDGMVAGVHFLPGDDPADLAHKILAVNMSDLAAKGAEPLAYSLVMALPRGTSDEWVAAFAAGLGAAQRAFKINLLGGDSVSTQGPLSLTINALGIVPRGTMIRRKGARPGDAVFVTGNIGDAALGLKLALGTLAQPVPDADRAYLVGRLRRPSPRLELVASLRVFATAALDVSDGLVGDLRHLAAASNVGIALDARTVPLSPAAARLVTRQPELLSAVLTGGDDYEVAFTAPAGKGDDIAAAASSAGVTVTRIGRVTEGPVGVAVLGMGGVEMPIGQGGWEHR
ncbi:thiamine-phosphate kinase [Niveispirillum sp. BGYR6]|uniref:thiamine-phosphate kinase n=1 Tax=Niveispirillum sp. BGYR6 TaxID=2971249 RepID=UPI0022B9C041|nr:thiamine-phosphate kinase [Niveispirillum sp. BGYR6]